MISIGTYAEAYVLILGLAPRLCAEAIDLGTEFWT